MLFEKLKVLHSHGVQYIKDLRAVELPAIFRGRPEIAPGMASHEAERLSRMCPAGAIGVSPVSIDLGKCIFCGECALRAPDHIKFTNDYRMAATLREDLIIKEGCFDPINVNKDVLRQCLHGIFKKALKLRQVSAGGDNGTEMELNASGNVNFDFGRYGVEFTASPRHADGVVITGPLTENMAVPLELCYNAVPSPKIVILAGADAISGGLFGGGKPFTGAVDRSFLSRHSPDLYIPGNPVHPLTFIFGCMDAFQ